MNEKEYYEQFNVKMQKREVDRIILRALKGKKGTGRKVSKNQIKELLEKYRNLTEEVECNLEWEDYFNLIDIGTHINVNNAVDLAFRIGFMTGKSGK